MNDEKLPQLTDKQYKFVEGIKKGLSKTEAYRQAYDISKMKVETVWRRAAEVAENSKVKAWLDYVQMEAVSRLVDETSYTLSEHIKELDHIKRLAMDAGQNQVAANCTIAKGKALNHYTEHKVVTHQSTADMQMLKELAQLLGQDAAEKAAIQMGITIEGEYADSTLQ